MTDKQWLISILKRPDDLEGSDENRLREMIAAYPYFQAPYLLLARALKIKSHPAFDELLPSVSLYAMDRSRFYELVNKSLPPTEDHKLPESLPEKENKAEVEAQVQEAVVERPIEERETKEEKYAEPASDKEEKVAEQAITIEDHIQEKVIAQESPIEDTEIEQENLSQEEASETEKTEPEISFETFRETEDESTPFVQNFPFTELEDEIPDAIEERNEKIAESGPVVSRFSFKEDAGEAEKENEKEEESTSEGSFQSLSNFAVDFSKVEKEEEDPDRQEKELPEITFGRRNPETDTEEILSEEKREEKINPEKTFPEQINSDSIKKTDFYHWLDEFKNGKKKVEDHSHEIESISNLYDVRVLVKEDEESEEEDKDDAVKSLIDRFIEKQPSVTRIKAEFYDPVNRARESEKEYEEMVTETLAKIYINQQLYQKGIRAYEKLMLKFPQKSDYFAALIEQVKKDNKL